MKLNGILTAVVSVCGGWVIGTPVVAQEPQPAELQPAPNGYSFLTPSTSATRPSTSSPSATATKKPDFPSHTKVLEGFRKLKDGEKTFYTLYVRDKDQQIYAELPKTYASEKHFFAMTVASGDSYAGLQAGDLYAYWRKYDKRLALIEPNFEIRSTGDKESSDSVKRLFTDRVILDIPIVTMIPKGGPLIDLDELLVGQASKFFGSKAAGINKKLFKLTAKAFSQNVEVRFELPMANGRLRALHYSISNIPKANPKGGYKPRKADERVGYFTTSYSDFGMFEENKTRVRYINRWHLQKRDPKLKLSPPSEPIIFYIEHTTPVRYRRWVADGGTMWNKAFEKVGLINAIEVRFQDAASGAHMEKDPEDKNYNFIRWLNNGIGTAIGPSRVHPETGQILDADVVLTDGWIRHWWAQYNEVMPQIAIEGFTPETLAWLHQHPKWDPRIRLAPPSKRADLLAARASQPTPILGGHAAAMVDGTMIGDQEYDGLIGRASQVNGHCMAANCKTHGIGVMAMSLELAAANAAFNVATSEDGEGEQMVDGIPEKFIGPLLSDLVAHEVGHTIGLRHNFKGSSIYTYEQINSEEVIGKKPFSGSVMDYTPVNIVVEKGDRKQGDYGMIAVGPYDEWAIQYGYSFEKDLNPILARVAEPQLAFATDEDTAGPDPLARRYDFAKDPLPFARNQMDLARDHRGKIVEKFVKEGDSWSKARRGYELTLRTQVSALGMMANWVGGAFVYRDRKGDPNGRAPIEVVPTEKQRAALDFVVENTFKDEAWGLSPELLKHLTLDKWWDANNAFEDPTWPVHDRILAIQASVLTAMLNPSTLTNIYDNEFRVPSDQDAVTLPEVLDKIETAIWSELANTDGQFTARKPMISSLRRNLQREHLERLMDLAQTRSNFSPAYKPISDLAAGQLEDLKGRANTALEAGGVDPYTKAHLREAVNRITKTIDARYVIQQ